jgi:hypothetical protein
VSLYGQRELICEHYIQGEYGPESDQEEMVHVWLSKNAELVHHIPLIHWGLSLRCSTLVPYAESVCVTINENPPPFSGRERILKTSRNRVGYDLPGWNLQSDMITLRFHSNSSWTLCQDRHWRDAPSGFPYHAFIEIKLLPGAENNDDEVLCKLISNLPWNDPNKAEDSSRNLYNWMNTDFLTEMIENLSAQVQANPMSHASVELDEVQTQLSRLASKN